jgi:hypothetical protein
MTLPVCRLAAPETAKSGRQPLAAAHTAGCDDFLSAFGCHARPEAVAALADKFRGLVGALHLFRYRGVRPFLVLSVNDGTGAFSGPGQARLIPRRTFGPDVAGLIGGDKRKSQFPLQKSRAGDEPVTTGQQRVRYSVIVLQLVAFAVLAASHEGSASLMGFNMDICRLGKRDPLPGAHAAFGAADWLKRAWPSTSAAPEKAVAMAGVEISRYEYDWNLNDV